MPENSPSPWAPASAEPIKRGRGRPAKAGAKSNADRQRDHRAKMKRAGTKALPKIDAADLQRHPQFTQLRDDMAAMFAIAEDLLRARQRGTKVASDVLVRQDLALEEVRSRYAFL